MPERDDDEQDEGGDAEYLAGRENDAPKAVITDYQTAGNQDRRDGERFEDVVRCFQNVSSPGFAVSGPPSRLPKRLSRGFITFLMRFASEVLLLFIIIIGAHVVNSPSPVS